MRSNSLPGFAREMSDAKILRLFLDYDGTLAEFSRTPGESLPNGEVNALLADLAKDPGILPAVITGRSLHDIQRLIPVQGILLGGTYGIEMQLPNGEILQDLSFESIRADILQVLPVWQEKIDGKEGFYLEDKGWSIALHGRFAEMRDFLKIATAIKTGMDGVTFTNEFKFIEGMKFLELAPSSADKADFVQRVISGMTPPGSALLYIGDDEKDEEALRRVIANGGFAIKVTGGNGPDTEAQFTAVNPQEVRDWLRILIELRSKKRTPSGK